MYHSITFVDILNPSISINTWDDWHLIPTSRPLISPPSVQVKSVQVIGANGSIDLTDILTGHPTYANRSGNLEFAVVNDYWNWEVAYATILKRLHGRRWKMILEDDPGYYYIGRFSVNSWASDKNYSRVAISYDVAPFKKDIKSSNEQWLWDTFCFVNGIIRNTGEISITDTATIVLVGSQEPITPIITSNAVMSLSHTFDGVTKTYSIASGVSKPRGLIIGDGENTLIFTGTGTVSIDYRGGYL